MDKHIVSKEIMCSIYEQIKTPFKCGAVIKDDENLADSPTVFKHNGKWYMYFIKINKNTGDSGYETHLASSDNLLDWKYEHVVLKRTDDGSWDSKQVAGYAAFADIDFGGSSEMQKVNGKYYLSYIGGALDGYETDPLSIGQAYSDNPIGEFTKFEKPILGPYDSDNRELETRTLYKSYLFVDDAMTTGHKYVNAYNAKAQDYKERIFLAVSDDGENWERYGDKPIIDETQSIADLGITGDPQIVKIGDVYVMFYFRYIKDRGTHNNFACSYNLTDWTIWDGDPLVINEYEWENEGAHKSYVVKSDGVVYHFYCAKNEKGERFIALATSKNFNII